MFLSGVCGCDAFVGRDSNEMRPWRGRPDTGRSTDATVRSAPAPVSQPMTAAAAAPASPGGASDVRRTPVPTGTRVPPIASKPATSASLSSATDSDGSAGGATSERSTAAAQTATPPANAPAARSAPPARGELSITEDSSEIPPEALAPALPRESVSPTVASSDAGATRGTGSADLAKARELFDAGRPLDARAALGAAINRTPGGAPPRDVRDVAARIADETVFSSRITRDDPLVEVYTVQPNELLSTIARRFEVPYEIVMRINHISDAGRLRAGQRIKIPRGPFHAQIHLSDFRIDLYLQDTYVRSYPVGVGRSETGTPGGVWQVTDRLIDPTYYPPPSAQGRPIIPGGRPENPLGTRWIGLKGIEGGAVGQQSFGVHGTNEPDSIGSAASMGCIRMRNDDVQVVYDALTPGRSTVTTVP